MTQDPAVSRQFTSSHVSHVGRQRSTLDLPSDHPSRDGKDRRGSQEITSVYRLYDPDGGLLYVGITCRLVSRMLQHRRSQSWGDDIAFVEWDEFADDRAAAAVEERRAIREERPRHNVQGSVPVRR